MRKLVRLRINHSPRNYDYVSFRVKTLGGSTLVSTSLDVPHLDGLERIDRFIEKTYALRNEYRVNRVVKRLLRYRRKYEALIPHE